jgi:NAD+ synthetase
MNQELLLKYLREETRKYIIANNIKSLVLGVSGGFDSAIVAAIVNPICEELNIPLIGMSLPSNTNKDEEIERANNIIKYFCKKIPFSMELDIHDMYANFVNLLSNEHLEMNKIRKGNIKARIRMILLYDKAQETSGMVLSTDNYTEYLLGFWTLHGDVGDFGIIQNLYKTELYELAQHIVDNHTIDCNKKKALQACIDATPTDGLGITESDMESIGLPTYKEIDERLQYYMDGGQEIENCPIYSRMIKTNYKRENPYNLAIKRNVFLKNMF